MNAVDRCQGDPGIARLAFKALENTCGARLALALVFRLRDERVALPITFLPMSGGPRGITAA